jgi:hypothetical protein
VCGWHQRPAIRLAIMDIPPNGYTISYEVCSMRRVALYRRVAGRFCRKPERRTAAPHARRRVGQGTTRLAGHENHAYTMSNEHHNRWSDRDVSRGQLIGGSRCGVRVGGDLGRWPSSRARLRSSRFVQGFGAKALYGVHDHP